MELGEYALNNLSERIIPFQWIAVSQSHSFYLIQLYTLASIHGTHLQ